MKLGEFLAALKWYRWTFAITVGTVLVLGLGWLFLTPSKYVSTTRLMVSVEGSTTADAYQNDDVVAGRINTYIGLLTSDVVNQRVVDKLHLPETPRQLAGKVNATAVQPRTSLIDITVTDSSAERAQQIAQTLADQFVLYADAVETPTGQDDQKVHTTVVTSATPPQGNMIVRTILGGLVALAALLLGACAVWIRAVRNPELQPAHRTAADPTPGTDVEPLSDVVAPARPQPDLVPEIPPTKEPHARHETAPIAGTPSSDGVASVPTKTVDLIATYRRLRARLGARTTRPGEATIETAADEPSGPSAPTVAVPAQLVAPTDGQHSAPKDTAPTDSLDVNSDEAVASESVPVSAATDGAAVPDDSPQLTDRLAEEEPLADGDAIPHDVPRQPFEPTAPATNGTPPSAQQRATVSAPRQRTIDLGDTYRLLRTHLQALVARTREQLRTWVASRSARNAVENRAAIHSEPPAQPEIESAESEERTPWLLGFLCLLTSFLPSYLVPTGPLKSNGSPAKLIAIMCFGLAILGFVLVRRTRATRAVQPGIIIILLFFLIQLLVYGVGMIEPGDLTIQASRTRALLNLLAYVGLALFILLRVHTTRQRKIILGCLAVGLAYNCVAGLLQSMTHIDLRYYFQPPGFVFNTEDFDFGTRGGVKRVIGTTLHAIEFSLIAAVAVPLGIYFSKYATTRWSRIGGMLLSALALISMPAAVSRTGVIGLAVALFVYFWCFKVRQIATALVVGIAMLVGYAMIAPAVITALWATIAGSREDDSVAGRIADYAQVSRTFHEHPLFGLGLGGSPPNEYGLLDNEWLQALVQGGLLGVTAMLTLSVGGILGFAAALRKATTPAQRNQAYALGSMFMGILVCSYFFDLFSFQQATRILFICFALMWSTYTIPLSPSTTLDSGFPPTLPRKPVLAMKKMVAATSTPVQP